MKNISLFLVSSLAIMSCNSVGIEECHTEILEFKDLPREVKDVIFIEDYLELNEPNRFELVSKQDKLLPWIYNSNLNRISDSKMFHLNFDSEHGATCIILGDYVYIPRHYNIYEKDSMTYSFSKYLLD